MFGALKARKKRFVSQFEMCWQMSFQRFSLPRNLLFCTDVVGRLGDKRKSSILRALLLQGITVTFSGVVFSGENAGHVLGRSLPQHDRQFSFDISKDLKLWDQCRGSLLADVTWHALSGD